MFFLHMCIVCLVTLKIGKTIIEPSLERKFYLSFTDFSIRSIFTKFRISDHSLEIETKNKNLYSQINYTLQWYREVTYKNTTQHIHDQLATLFI
jgi:hypothetical protein